MNRHDGIEGIVFAIQQRSGLEPFQVVAEPPHFGLQLLLDVFTLTRQIKIRIDVSQASGELPVLLDGFLQALALGKQLLSRFGILPEAQPTYLVVSGVKLASAGRSVKENSGAQRPAAAGQCIRVPVLRSWLLQSGARDSGLGTRALFLLFAPIPT
jgi:hypothetical protein